MNINKRIKKLEDSVRAQEIEIHVLVADKHSTPEQVIDDYLSGKQPFKPTFFDGATPEEIRASFLSDTDEKQVRFIQRNLIEPKKDK